MRLHPVIVKRSTVVPSATHEEDLGAGDAIRTVLATSPETVDASDLLRRVLTFHGEDIAAADAMAADVDARDVNEEALAVAEAVAADARLIEALDGRARMVRVAPGIYETTVFPELLASVAPTLPEPFASRESRADFRATNVRNMGDGYVDEDQPTTNFGSAGSLFARRNNKVGGIGPGERRAYAKWNLTPFVQAQWQGVTSANARYRWRNDSGGSLGFTRRLVRHDTDPFAEGSLTWNTRPAGGTQLASGIATSPATFGDGTITLAFGDFLPCLGRYLLLEWHADNFAAGVTAQLEVASKEHASELPPRLDFTLRHASVA